jgi:hypothetical protein
VDHPPGESNLSMLDRLADGLWAVKRPFRTMGLAMASRMTVVRLEDGGLLLHSPAPPDPDVRAAVDGLGPVRHLVAPNQMHHLFCGDWQAAHPQARLWGAPGLIGKRRDLAFAGELGDTAPDAWAGMLDQVLVRGIPMLNEVTFLHRPSRTLVLTDLAANGGPDDPWALRLWLRLNGAHGRLAVPLEVRLLCSDRAAAGRDVGRILAWDAARIVVGHGAIVEDDARAALERAFAWLLRGRGEGR